MCVFVCAQSCLTLCDPIDCNPPDSSVHGFSQARILEWVVISSSRRSSWPRDWTRIYLLHLQHCRESLSPLSHGRSLIYNKPAQCFSTVKAFTVTTLELSPHNFCVSPCDLSHFTSVLGITCSYSIKCVLLLPEPCSSPILLPYWQLLSVTFADLSCTSSWMSEFSGLRNSFPDILLILLSKYPHLSPALKNMIRFLKVSFLT